jgi:hypothetical protein
VAESPAIVSCSSQCGCIGCWTAGQYTLWHRGKVSRYCPGGLVRAASSTSLILAVAYVVHTDVEHVCLVVLGHLQVLLVPPVAQPRPTKAPPALPRLPPPSRALTARLFPFVPSLLRTPSTIFSKFVSTTTPPTTISPKTACSVSNPKMRSSSQTFSNSLSRASTKTCIKSSRASGDSVLVEIRIKYSVA